MAESQLQSTIDISAETSRQSELEMSASLLPQEETRTGCQAASTSYESSFELSGFSCVLPSGNEYNSETDDPFNNVFYRIIPSEKSTHIHFYARPLFNMILSVLEKEFSTPGDDVSKFLLKTHIDGKKCHIHVDRSDCTIAATGAGHTSWKEISFRKMAMNMFNKFVDKTNSTVYIKGNNVSETPTCSNNSQTMATDSPLLRNISALMDMIHTLQGQVTKLTEEVNRLVKKAAASFTQTVNDSTLTPAKDNPKSGNVRNQSNAGNEMTNISNYAHVQDLSNQTDFTADVIRLTSTPGPTPTQLQETFVIPNSPSNNNPQPTKTNPVPKSKPSVPVQSAKKILLIGDSTITGVNKQGLKDNVYKHGISGATVQMLLTEMEVYDLQQFSHAVIYVGGNNSLAKTSIKQFEDLYGQLLTHIKRKSDCKIILITCCPRADADINAVNDVICRLSELHGTELVDACKAFYDKKGYLISKYFSSDSIHLSDSGIRRLMGSINGKLEIIQNFTYCAFDKPASRRYKHSPRIRRTNLIYPKQDGGLLPCAKCGENNHETRSCRHTEQLKCHQCGYYGHKSRRCGAQ